MSIFLLGGRSQDCWLFERLKFTEAQGGRRARGLDGGKPRHVGRRPGRSRFEPDCLRRAGCGTGTRCTIRVKFPWPGRKEAAETQTLTPAQSFDFAFEHASEPRPLALICTALAGDHPCVAFLEMFLNVIVSSAHGLTGAGLNIFADLRLPCTDHTRDRSGDDRGGSKFCRASDKAAFALTSAAGELPARIAQSRDLLLARCKRRAAFIRIGLRGERRRAFLFGIATRALPSPPTPQNVSSPSRARSLGIRRADRGRLPP